MNQGDRMIFTGYHLFSDIEMMPKGVNKGSALVELCEMQEISINRTFLSATVTMTMTWKYLKVPVLVHVLPKLRLSCRSIVIVFSDHVWKLLLQITYI